MNESNASLYTTTPQSSASSHDAALSSAVNSEVVKSINASSSVSSDASSADAESATATSSAEQTQDDYLASLQDKTLEERTEVNDVTSKDRDVTVTEKDGSKVKVQLHAPSYEEAETINSKRAGFDVNEELSVSTPVRFEKALAKIVGNLTINGKPAGRFGFKLADDGHTDAYRAIINKADSFLTDIVNAD